MTAKSSRTWGIWPMGGFVAIGSRSDKSLKTQEYPDYESLENNVPLLLSNEGTYGYEPDCSAAQGVADARRN